MHGARCKVIIANPNPDGYSGVIGTFNNVSWSYGYDIRTVDVLGLERPAESVITGQMPIRLTCSGFRSIDFGPFTQPGMPPLNQILTHEYLTIELFDRQTGRSIAVIKECRPENFDSSITPRELTQMNLTYIGLAFSDETTAINQNMADNQPRTDAVKYPQ
jgi:hypothetical protein